MATQTSTLGIGSTLISKKDGMVMIYVPAGEFMMGNTAEDALVDCQNVKSRCQLDYFEDEEPPHIVYLDSYWIDQTEITNAAYAKCVDEKICDPPSSIGSYTRDYYFENSDFDDYPVIYMSWNDAITYCEWAGGRLPTEAEWEKAASWDEEKQIKYTYPWGDSIDCTRANYRRQNGICIGETSAVGSYDKGKSPYGTYDMAGNVWEWVSSLSSSYPYSVNNGREDLSSNGYRVLRGGSWYDFSSDVRSTNRHGAEKGFYWHDIGFRCAMDAE